VNISNFKYLDKKCKKFIDKNEVDVLFEIGSRDCLDAIALNEFYNKKVYSFECNPASIELCKQNLIEQRITNDRVELFEIAVFNENKNIDFHPVVSSKIGVSSVFKISKDFQLKKFKRERHAQGEKITVPAVRLDTFMLANNLDRIDLLCMDLQGAELMALEGLGEKLKKVKYIMTRVGPFARDSE
jgi:FkbM family methyltransferase